MESSEANFPTGHAASSGCDFRLRLGAYHDGELSPGAAAQIEKHLPNCDACQSELEALRDLTALAGMIGAGGISPFGLQRIHQAIDAEPRFSILRIASILTGLAASALIIGAAWLWDTPQTQATPAKIVIVPQERGQDWMTIATTLEPRPLPRAPWEMRDQQMLADARFSNWMVEGLTERQP